MSYLAAAAIAETLKTTSGNATFMIDAADMAVITWRHSTVNMLSFAASGTNWWISDSTSGGMYALYMRPSTTRTACYLDTQVTFRVGTTAGGSLVAADAALATDATTGFFYAPSCAGAPTGTPASQTGTVPLVVDTTDSRIYVRIGSSWKSVTVS